LGSRWRRNLQIWIVAVSTMNKLSWTDDTVWPSSLVAGQRGNNYSPQNVACYVILHRASDLDRFFGTMAMENRHEIWNMECQESLKVSSKYKVN
jgi:hypothetical protein